MLEELNVGSATFVILEVYKKPESQGFYHNFPATHKGYNSAVEFSIIGQSRHEKDLVLCLLRILVQCVEVLR